jgi:hypothetical protein
MTTYETAGLIGACFGLCAGGTIIGLILRKARPDLLCSLLGHKGMQTKISDEGHYYVLCDRCKSWQPKVFTTPPSRST